VNILRREFDVRSTNRADARGLRAPLVADRDHASAGDPTRLH